MNNVCKVVRLHFLFLEPIHLIEIISDVSPSNRILVCDKLCVNPIQKYCFSRKIVSTVRVIMEVEVLLVVSH